MKKLLSFLAGFVLIVLMVLFSIAGPATSPGLFVRALQETVTIDVSDEELALFGEETIRYLRGEKDAWQPEIGIPIAPAFVDHMAQVKSWVMALPWIFGAGMVLIVVCLFVGVDRRTFVLGLLSVIALALALILWAVIDFRSFWMILHRVLIPDGIFSASEPVMQLFPLALFIRYVPYVAAVLGLELTALFVLFYVRKGKVS